MPNEKFKIVFINYGGYAGCCGVHIHFLANTLVAMGYECSVFLFNTKGAAEYFGTANYPIYAYADLETLPVEYFENSIIHAWTTRETVRHPTNLLRSRIKLPYIVHLEDDEIFITGKFLGAYTLAEQKALVQKDPQKYKKIVYTHPLHFEAFMRASSGVSCIMKTLEDFVPKEVPTMTFWPACEQSFFELSRQRDVELRALCGLTDETYALVYPGAVHSYNGPYFIELLRAVQMLEQDGFSMKIMRCGIEDFKYSAHEFALYKKYVVYLEGVVAHELPAFMGIADFLVQPGAPRTFDDHRFPSKVPFFLASGRPTILPDTNVAEKLRHGHDCFLLKTGDALEIAKYLKMLILQPDLAQRIGSNGRETARTLFSWPKAAASLIPFYKRALLQANL